MKPGCRLGVDAFALAIVMIVVVWVIRTIP